MCLNSSTELSTSVYYHRVTNYLVPPQARPPLRLAINAHARQMFFLFLDSTIQTKNSVDKREFESVLIMDISTLYTQI